MNTSNSIFYKRLRLLAFLGNSLTFKFYNILQKKVKNNKFFFFVKKLRLNIFYKRYLRSLWLESSFIKSVIKKFLFFIKLKGNKFFMTDKLRFVNMVLN